MPAVAITGSGLFTPPHSISNAELVAAFNAWVQQYNAEHSEAISAGTLAAKAESSVAFIVKASGIHSRYAMDKDGILDVSRMRPSLPARSNDEPSIQCDMAIAAAEQALAQAGRSAADVDAVIVACSNLQRAYPAVAVEVQSAMGIDGWAYDMNVACSSAPFGLQAAADALRLGNARAVLLLNPEICTAHLNFTDRDSHFIFGDACTALLLERTDDIAEDAGWEVLDTRLRTRFSNNIRNNFGFLNRTEPADSPSEDKLFVQQGRRVFKDVVPLVNEQIGIQLGELGLQASDLKRLWLHQANLSMNQLIARKVLGHEPTADEMPIVLDRYANTSSAGSVIAFHLHRDGLVSGDHALLCAFGAGYSCGSAVLRKR